MTIDLLTAQTQDLVHGYVRDQEQVTTLSQPITETSTSLTVAEPEQIARGTVEIDDELIYVLDSDLTNNVIQIPPWGRGQSFSIPATHAAGARIINSPLFPRQRVKSALFATLRESFPDIFAVDVQYIDVNPARTNYPMSSNCYKVMWVEWHVPGPTRMWAPVQRWRTNNLPGSVELELIGPVWPGPQRVRVRYMKNPPADWGTTDDLQALGYSLEIADILVYGAAARLMMGVETVRVSVQSMESHGRSETIPPGSATAASRYLYQQYKQRLESERLQLLLRYPIQPHVTR